MPRSQRWVLWGILAVALGLRVAWVLYATRSPTSPIGSGDPYFYYRYAKQLAAGHGYNGLNGKPTAYYPIGYPLALAGLFWVVRHTPLPHDLPMAASLAQAVLSTASVGLVFIVARRIFGAPAGLLAAATLALFPNIIFYVSSMETETLFIFLVLVCVAILVTHDWSVGAPSWRRLLVFGAALGASALVKPFSVPLLAGLALVLLLMGTGWRRMLAAVGVAGAAFVVVVTPWLVRNEVRMHTLAFSTNMGDTLCIDRYVGSNGRFHFVDKPYCASAREPEAQRNRDNIRIALRFVAHHPGLELRLIGKRFWYMMENDRGGLQPTRSFMSSGARHALSRIADGYYFAALAVAVLGLPLFVVERRPDRLFTLTAIATVLGVPLTLWGATRFHMPLLPFVAIAAGAAIARLLALVATPSRRARSSSPRTAEAATGRVEGRAAERTGA